VDIDGRPVSDPAAPLSLTRVDAPRGLFCSCQEPPNAAICYRCAKRSVAECCAQESGNASQVNKLHDQFWVTSTSLFLQTRLQPQHFFHCFHRHTLCARFPLRPIHQVVVAVFPPPLMPSPHRSIADKGDIHGAHTILYPISRCSAHGAFRPGPRQARPCRKGFLVYFGTYTRREGKGIYAYRFQPATAKLTPVGLVAETEDPSFLTIHPNHSTQ
jgi:hypothetical protein